MAALALDKWPVRSGYEEWLTGDTSQKCQGRKHREGWTDHKTYPGDRRCWDLHWYSDASLSRLRWGTLRPVLGQLLTIPCSLVEDLLSVTARLGDAAIVNTRCLVAREILWDFTRSSTLVVWSECTPPSLKLKNMGEDCKGGNSFPSHPCELHFSLAVTWPESHPPCFLSFSLWAPGF